MSEKCKAQTCDPLRERDKTKSKTGTRTHRADDTSQSSRHRHCLPPPPAPVDPTTRRYHPKTRGMSTDLESDEPTTTPLLDERMICKERTRTENSFTTLSPVTMISSFELLHICFRNGFDVNFLILSLTCKRQPPPKIARTHKKSLRVQRR